MTDTSRQNIDIITEYVRFKYSSCFTKPRMVEFDYKDNLHFVVTGLMQLSLKDYVLLERLNRLGRTEEEALEKYIAFVFRGNESLNSMKLKLAIAGIPWESEENEKK